MEFTSFKINNFRGIQNLELNLSSQPRSRIYPLVGLNESGKTTILEAINYFADKNETLDPLHGAAIKDLHSLIPLSQRSNFNGVVKFETDLLLDEEDILRIKEFLHKKSYKELEIGNTIKIFSSIEFKDSKAKSDNLKVTWRWLKKGKKKGSRKQDNIVDLDWYDLVKFTRSLIPSVLYFPTFLFEFPDKIYLENHTDLDEKQKYYQTVLQDILDATETSTNIQTHIVERAESEDKSDKRNLDNLLLEMGRHVTKTVFEAWNKIFKSPLSQRTVRFELDNDESGGWYVQLTIEDTDGIYLLSERSLGFRWFFIFLLLTHYRGFRKGSSKNVLFLFDEPASNLHASAQAQLLNSFGAISQHCMIIYTTHSHHMIDVNYLDGTYVIKNEGIDYDTKDDRYTARKTNITATKYRNFVTNHPDQTNYYKPILDVLDYQPSQLEHVPHVVMVEGKSDFYILKYFSEILLKKSPIRNFLPGTGSGSLDKPIQLYLAWGRSFLILLDSDKEGKVQKKRYSETFGILCERKIFNLDEINAEWNNYAIEKLIDNEDKLLIQKISYPDATKYHKSHFHKAIQEALMLKRKIEIGDKSLKNVTTLLEYLKNESYK